MLHTHQNALYYLALPPTRQPAKRVSPARSPPRIRAMLCRSHMRALSQVQGGDDAAHTECQTKERPP
jgi:hypothetical protein